jgi:hypothetical protein
MMPVGDTAAHLRKQVGGLFFYTPEVRGWRCFIEKDVFAASFAGS